MDTVAQNFNDSATHTESLLNSNASAKTSMNEAVRNVKKAATNVKDAANTLRQTAGDDISAYVAQGQDKFNEVSGKASQMAREKPLYVVGGAFVAGFLLSRLLK